MRALRRVVSIARRHGRPGCLRPVRDATMLRLHMGTDPARQRHLRPSPGALRKRGRRREHSRLGVRARPAGRRHRHGLQHLRSRVHRERRDHRRSRHRQVWRPALGRPAHRRRRVHRAERDVLERQIPAEQALPDRGAADAHRPRRVDRRRRHHPARAAHRRARAWSAPARWSPTMSRRERWSRATRRASSATWTRRGARIRRRCRRSAIEVSADVGRAA